jgi:aldehyde:ferredoxin oxidoreductase
MNSMTACVFVYGASWQLLGPQELCDLVRGVTGWDMNMDELLLVGERSVNMQRIFNNCEGIDRSQDTLPKKFFKKALKGGRSDGLRLDQKQFELAREEYYRQSGWDVTTGIPTREKLQELGLSWAVKLL